MAIGVFIPAVPGAAEKIRAELHAANLTRFVGGQAENHLEGGIMNGGKVFRGDIASIGIVDDTFVVRFVWLGVMAKLGVWTSDPNLDLKIAVVLIGSCEEDGQGRLVLQAPIVDQLLVLFPPGYTVDGEPRSLLRSQVPGA